MQQRPNNSFKADGFSAVQPRSSGPKEEIMAPLTQAFRIQIREVVAPALKEAGFVFDGSRTFRRFVQDTKYVQIVNFQLGVRSMKERFTVNLAVYHPDHCASLFEPKKVTDAHCLPGHRERLGVLTQRRHKSLERIPVIGLFFIRRDRRWRATNPGALENAREVLLSKGFSWLEQKTFGFNHDTKQDQDPNE